MVFTRSIATACMNFSKMALIFTDFPVGNGSKTCALLEICGYQASRRFLSKQEKFQHRLALPYIKYNCAVQWRIQDFPEAGAPIPKLVLFCKFFAKNCKKMKELGSPGASLVPALDLPMQHYFCDIVIYLCLQVYFLTDHRCKTSIRSWWNTRKCHIRLMFLQGAKARNTKLSDVKVSPCCFRFRRGERVAVFSCVYESWYSSHGVTVETCADAQPGHLPSPRHLKRNKGSTNKWKVNTEPKEKVKYYLMFEASRCEV